MPRRMRSCNAKALYTVLQRPSRDASRAAVAGARDELSVEKPTLSTSRPPVVRRRELGGPESFVRVTPARSAPGFERLDARVEPRPPEEPRESEAGRVVKKVIS